MHMYQSLTSWWCSFMRSQPQHFNWVEGALPLVLMGSLFSNYSVMSCKILTCKLKPVESDMQLALSIPGKTVALC